MLRHPGLPRSAAAASRLPPALRGTLWGFIAVAIWGLYLASARAGVAAGTAPTDLAFLRYGTSGLILLPWLLRHSPRSAGGIGWRRATVLTLLAGPLFILIGTTGFRFAPLAHGAVVQPAALTLGGVLLGAWVLKDRLTPMRFAGAAVILMGLAGIAGPGLLQGGPAALVGDALFAAAGLMWAVFAVLQKRWTIAPLAATAVVSVLSLVAYAPAYLVLRGPAALLALPAGTLMQQIIIHGVLSGIVAVFAFGRAVELLGPPRAAAFPALVPAVAILVGIPVTGEWPLPVQLAGLGIVTLGLLISQLRRTPRPLAAPCGRLPLSA
jgi:drug/metabolite transporter (DMT)-like permease